MSEAADAILLSQPNTAKKYLNSLISKEDIWDEGEFFSQTRTLKLPELERLLTQIQGDLTTELGNLVNRDFDKFVQLFRQVGEVEEEDFIQWDNKLAYLISSTESLNGRAKDDLNAFQNDLSQLKINIEKQKELQLDCRLVDDLNRLEKAIVSLQSTKDPVDLEIAAELFIQLEQTIKENSLQISDVQSTKWSKLMETFFIYLDDVLTGIFMSSGTDSHMIDQWTSLAFVYIRLGRRKPLEETVFNDLWRPKLTKLLMKTRLETLRKAQGESFGLAVFGELFEEIQSVHAVWFSSEFMADVGSAMEVLFMESILNNTLSYLIEECHTSLLSPAIPALFHSNYMAGIKFVQNIASILSPEVLGLWITGQAYKNYNQAWQLPVYFQLCFREIAQNLEDALSKLDQGQLSSGEFLRSLEAILKKTISPEIILPPLRPKFFRLHLQTLARCLAWIKEKLTRPIDGHSGDLMVVLGRHIELLNLADSLIDVQKQALSAKPIQGLEFYQERLEPIKIRFQNNQEAAVKSLRSGFKQIFKEGLEKIIQKANVNDPWIPWKDICATVRQEALCEQIIVECSKDAADVLRVLLGQVRKAASNYRRIRALSKPNDKSTFPGEDKEAQEQQFITRVGDEVAYLLEFLSSEIGTSNSGSRIEYLLSLKGLWTDFLDQLRKTSISTNSSTVSLN